MGDVFIAAGRLGIVPTNLGEDLASLAELRNQVMHENARIDNGLLVYDRLLQLIMAGFATRLAVEASAAQYSSEEDTRHHFPVVVDRMFVKARIGGSRQSASGTKAIRRLDREAHPPRYVINGK
jgi:hypothetical protein